MKANTMTIALVCLMAVMVAALAPAVDAQDIVGKVIAGYQGWFCEPGDGSPVGNLPDHHGNYHGNYETYPDMREFPLSEQFLNPDGWTPLPNGNPAMVFSSARAFTVDLHVQWMKQYGIDCAALQRFGEVATDPIQRQQKNDVTVLLKNACEKHGVKFYMEYDCSGSGGKGWGDDWVSGIQNDWRDLTNRLHVPQSPAYARQNHKTVVELWGMGLDGNSTSSDTSQWLALIQWFHAQGCYVIGGVPTGWLSTSHYHDARPGFESVYAACDAISPWVVGRYSSTQGVDSYADTNLKPEAAWCATHQIDYIPCVYPGTSFYNSNHQVKNVIPRDHGLLLWEQFVNLRRLGIKTCFVSMFDEYNEATAIAKSAENASFTPSGQWFLWLDADGVSISSDFYLRLTHDGGDMIKGQKPLTPEMPTPYWDDLFSTGFESGQPQPTLDDGNAAQCSVQTGGTAQSGVAALEISGTANGGNTTHREYSLFDLTGKNAVIGPNTLLYYWVYPTNDNARYLGLDVQFTDGSKLSTSRCVDQNGHPLRASAGHGGNIPLNAWTVITSRLGALSGKRIAKIEVVFDHPGATGTYQGFVDDIRLTR
jgi:hypothetical protein